MRKSLSKILARAGYAYHQVPVFQQLAWLKQTESWTDAQRQQWRLERLNRILDFAWKNVPFYQQYWGDHGVKPGALRNFDELQRYPVLRKETFRANWEKIRPTNVESIPYLRKHTGGTTGRPVHYLLDREQWALMQAFILWGWELAGYSFGDPVGVLTGGSLLPQRVSLFERVRNFIENRLFLFGVHMDRELALDYYKRLTQFGAKYLYGYPSIISVFARHIETEGWKVPSLRGVIVTSEMLQPQYRQTIERALHCPVYNDYGCNDGGLESFECTRHDGFHYNDFQSILQVEEGGGELQQGALMITNLWNRATPFIRYENGDRVRLTTELCPCGSKFPLIANVEGRTADILTFANGQSFVCPPHLFGDMQIDGWQIVQTHPLRVEVRLAKVGQLDPDYRARVERVMRHHLHDEIQIDVKHVEKLSPPSGGKLKPVWSEVRNAMEQAVH